ncbi:rhamnogalacturonan lyase [Curtobacterium flaccumfaciens]|uniref:rhamnogalacturonan lyase n=1 Tax=Curtobacterium flaccumfaciens TaxID=2035 RepID=UPI001BDDE813|nr:rhamnogalacturonan lyase [Curtobacterium flaccumfaciens]MBT1607256.1 rhamnogalacturonan lyase [Curtobacterium flaccumfaciens pv. betae]MBT1656775.1 rhamnogalacturonan lyase [Curtobacterium flaccumfaciens pv. betae]MCS0472531.1 rhamnogalacturonan lyase [Curtobacterium flaccumfaciens pv. betae]MCS0476109.1 rhamnogalacturonan lyase [Curtobacterium flaccumfaciens pv. betae]MCS0479271.1 rhamnogalacturonan lyase [Curtobacterium flaccumfaciens pv. betae]
MSCVRVRAHLILRAATIAAVVACVVGAGHLSGTEARAAAAQSAASTAKPPYTGTRQMERLDRAPEAARVSNGVFLSWRMLATDPDSIAFVVYRDGAQITPRPLETATNYLDTAGLPTSRYEVRSITDGVERAVTAPFGVRTAPYVSVPLDRPDGGATPTGETYTYSANDTSVGDADGDGQYELFVKWDPSDSKDNGQPGYTGPVLLDAYRMDGTRLWRISLGPNIRAGAHYTQFQVYDYDGDGRAEVVMKTADGTVDGTGTVIGDGDADYRNARGYVLAGPEYLTVFSGLTGHAIDTVPYDPPRGDVASWGDTYGNRVDRFLAATAYLDGSHPSVLMTRGYYGRTALAAYDFDGTHLKERWKLDSSAPGQEAAAGQGHHNLAVADVDGDGRDEIVFGSMTVDDDGTLLYSTGLGHGDAIHVGDLVPDNPGLEVFAVHEFMSKSGNRAATMRDARTGRILWSIPGDRDTGFGLTADVDPRFPGSESWTYGLGPDGALQAQLRAADGSLITDAIPDSRFAIFWDGDALREQLGGTYDPATNAAVPVVSKWNWKTRQRDVLLQADGALTDNGTKVNPMLQADLLGDWREEMVVRSGDSKELRIYSTADPSDMRLRTFMQDPNYRLGVAWQNTGYNMPPQPSYFIGAGMATPPTPRVRLAGPDRSAPLQGQAPR